MGPVGRTETRASVVERLLELMREAKGQRCDLVVFTECALTPFFPRWWEEDLKSCDQWFEREMPGPETKLLFEEAEKLGIGFHLGYAELAEENGRYFHFNTSVLVGPDGRLIGKYRKIHLPGLTTQDGDNPHRCYEKRYFDVGNLGFGAWKAFGGVLGMCLGNDRRWPESYRMLGLQGAELILIGYNTVADHPQHPELDQLGNFHSMLCMQSGAYQNGAFVIGVAKAGHEEGISQIGRSAIISPSGEVVTQCTTLADELVVHRCNLDQTKLYKDHIFPFADRRRPEAYSLITETTGPVPPRDSLSGTQSARKKTAELGDPIVALFTEDYGYPLETAQHLSDQAKLAGQVGLETHEEHPEKIVKKLPEKPYDTTETEPSTIMASPRRRTNYQPRCEISQDPLTAIQEVLAGDYQYPSEKISPLQEQVARALALNPETEPAKSQQPVTTHSKAKTEVAPSAELSVLPIAEDIGWLPGRFVLTPEESEDRIAVIVARLRNDYRYTEEQAKQVAQQAQAAWDHANPPEEEPAPAEPESKTPITTIGEPGPTTIYIPEEHPDIAPPKGKPLTAHDGSDSSSQTIPALSGPEAVDVFQVFTEKYGYTSQVARSIAERANSSFRRWQNSQAPETTVSVPESSEPDPAPVPPQPVEPEPEKKEFVIVPCPECNFPLKIRQENYGLLGRKARCPQCQTKFRLPEQV